MPVNRSILTCICTGVALTSLANAQVRDSRELNIFIRTPDGSSSDGAVVSFLSARGQMEAATAAQGGFTAQDAMRGKVVLEVRHPNFGVATVYGSIERNDNWVGVSFVGPNQARLLVPGAGGHKSTAATPGGAALGPATCAAGAGDCCVADGTPGCDDIDCCQAICAADPFCCNTSWDSICANAALGNPLCDQGACGGGGGNPNCNPGAGSCCIADGTPGCDDPDCCAIVCAADPFCCDVAWDSICAGEAVSLCGDLCAPQECDPPLACPPGSLIEPEACGADTNGGCNSVPVAFTNAACGDTWCGTAWAAGGTRDTDWYLVCHGGGTLSATLVSEAQNLAFIVDGIGTCAPVVVGTIGCSANCANQVVASADLPAGQYVVFVAAGTCDGAGIFDGNPCGSTNDYYVSIACTPPAGGCDSDDDCAPGDVCIGGCCVTPPPPLCQDPGAGDCCTPWGGLGCNNPDCCLRVCGIDPFCCDVAWDSICADEAATFPQCNCAGGGNCPGAGGDCCTADGTPGCDDVDCCDAVCGVDPFCCDTAWDSICSGEACDLFAGVCDCCGGGGGSNCCVPNGGLGCDDPECEAIVCGLDPFCCDTAWDSICADEAAQFCGDLCGGGGNPACGPGAGDCCIADGTPGCDDVDCCEAICAADPFCCDTSWDSICSGAAQANPLCDQGACAGGDCCGDPGAGSCCVADGTPCCDDVDCCNIVCGVDPFCCDTSWDSICAGEAADLCGDLCAGACGPGVPFACGPGAGDCFVADGTPGCDDCDCCAIVCGIDPFCCDTAWDEICAGEASSFCGEACVLDCPPGSNNENEPCGADTNGGCNSIPPAFTNAACGQTWCGNTWAAGGTRDTDWYLINHDGGTISATVASEIPTTLFIVDGIGSCSPVVVGAIGCGSQCAATNPASASLPAGQYVVFVAPGDCAGGGLFDGFPCGGSLGNDYYVTISCTGPCLSDDDCPPGQICQDGICINPPPANDLCDNATALNVGSGGSVCIAGTNIDATNDGAPACPGGLPQVGPGVWYSFIGNGNTVTVSTCPGGGGGSSCCVPSGGLGCDDPECQAIVCGVDPFCCDVAWDGICAGEAEDLCGDLCQGPGGGCGGADYDTMLTVFCGDCPEAPASNCCIPNGGLGCDDPECEAAVCAIDPFCCDVAWDGICASEALDLCGDLCGAGGGGLCVVGNDDFCGLQSQVQFCAKAGSKYLILVHGFGGSVGNFELTVTDNGAACVPTVDCPLSCFQIISESTECIGATGNFNYHVVGINTCTNSPITFDFTAAGGHVGQQMCFKISLFDNNGDLCCNATVCTTVPDCLPNSQPCDLDGDQMIGVTDMLLLLAAWNSNPGGPPDYDGDGTVAISDFLYLLSNWGPCQ
jgi:hypothetical protein